MKRGSLIADRFRINKILFTTPFKAFIETKDSLVNKKAVVALYTDVPYTTQARLVENEYQILKELKPPFTLELYDKIDTGEEAFLVFVPPPPLGSVEKTLAKAPFHTQSRVVKDFFSFLAFMHDNNLFSGVVVPENLLVSKKGKLHIVDLSLFQKKNRSIKVPLPDSIFVPPEFYSSPRYTIPAEIYTAGISTALMFSGKRFPEGSYLRDNGHRTIEKFLFQIRKNLGNPGWLEPLGRSLSHTISERPKSLDAFFNALFPEDDLKNHRVTPHHAEPVLEETLSRSKEARVATSQALQKAYEQRHFHRASALSEDDIQVLIQKGTRDERVQNGLTLMKMWGRTGANKHLKNVISELNKLKLKGKDKKDYNYLLALFNYLTNDIRAAKTKLASTLPGPATAHILMGMIHQREGKFDRAANEYQNALSAAKEDKDKINAAVAEGNLAYVYQMIGKYEDAIPHYDAAINEILKLNAEHILASLYFNKASMLILFGSFSQATPLLKNALKITHKLKLRRQEGIICNLFSEIYKFTGEYTKQEETAKQAVNIFTELGDPYQLYRSYLQLGWNALRSEGPSKLKDVLIRIRALLDAHPVIEDSEHRMLHVCYLRKYSPYATEHMLSLLSNESEKLLSSPPLLYEWRKLRAYALRDAGRKKEARESLKEAKKILKSIGKAIPEDYQQYFDKFMERERLKSSLKASRYPTARRRLAMEMIDLLPQVYDSMTSAIKGITEKIPPQNQQHILMKDLQEVMEAESIVSYRFDKSDLVPVLTVGDVDPRDLLDRIDKHLYNLNRVKKIKETIDGKEMTILAAPVSTGKELTGIMVSILPKKQNPRSAIYGDILESYANLIEVIEISAITSTMTYQPEAITTPIADKKRPTRRTFVFGKSEQMLKIKEQISKVITTNSPLIVYGDDGTGKKTLAQYIHSMSTPEKTIEIVDCRQAEHSVLYNELFGSGSVSGAVERAKDGTLILLHIERLDWDLQNHLVYLLEEGSFKPSGANTYRTSNARIIGTTYEKMWEAVDAGRLNSQLVRLMGPIKFSIPSLPARIDDLENLVDEYLEVKSMNHKLTSEAVKELMGITWAFNTAELFRTIDNAGGMSKGVRIGEDLIQKATKSLIPTVSSTSEAATLTEMLRESEKKIIEAALEKYGYDKELTAGALGVSKSNLYKKMRDFSLTDKITKEQLIAAIKACNGNKRRAAELLSISRKTLYNKLAEYHLKL